MSQREVALAMATQKRKEKETLRRDIRAGRDTIGDAIERRDPRIMHLAIVDIVRMGALMGMNNVTAKQEAMGAAAARQHINLLIKLERASNITVWWTLDYLREHPGVAGNFHGRRASC